MSLQQLQTEKDKLTIFQKRLTSDMDELESENQRLKNVRTGSEAAADLQSRGSISPRSEKDDTKEVNA
jgi:hypothetical protein